MTNIQKIIVVFLGCGLAGSLAFAASLYPNLAVGLASLSTGVTAIMGGIVGWTPTVPE